MFDILENFLQLQEPITPRSWSCLKVMTREKTIIVVLKKRALEFNIYENHKYHEVS